MYYQKIKLAFAHLKIHAEVKAYLRTPAGRLQNCKREQQRAARLNELDQRSVHFAGALSTDIRVLTAMTNPGFVNPFAADAHRGDGTDRTGFYVTEHDYLADPCVIWQTPMQTHFSVLKLMDLPLTEKRIPIDEVDSKMDYVEHQLLQRYGGYNDFAWRRALMISGGVEDAAHRAAWNEPDHHMFHVGLRQDGAVRLLLERDIKHVTSEKKSSLTPTTLTSQST